MGHHYIQPGTDVGINPEISKQNTIHHTVLVQFFQDERWVSQNAMRRILFFFPKKLRLNHIPITNSMVAASG